MIPIDPPPEGFPPDKRANYEHDLSEKKNHAIDNGWFDELMKRIMTNGTVMRRYIFGSFVMSVIIGIVAIVLIDKADKQQFKSETAICAVVSYAEKQSFRVKLSAENAPEKNRKQIERVGEQLDQLATQMRETGVRCPPKENPREFTP